jgi:hypothetical protein
MYIRKIALIAALLYPIAAVSAEAPGPQVTTPSLVNLDASQVTQLQEARVHLIKVAASMRLESVTRVSFQGARELGNERRAPGRFQLQAGRRKVTGSLSLDGGQVLCALLPHCGGG